MSIIPENEHGFPDDNTLDSRSRKMVEIAAGLSWMEAMWLRKNREVPGPIIALHDPGIDNIDRIPCYGVNSLHPTSTDFIHIAAMLGPQQPFFSIHPPSRERNADRARSVADLAKYYVDALVQFQPTGPLALAGWSAGVVVALEMAQQLKKIHGREVSLLVAIDFAPRNNDVAKRPFTAFENYARFYYRKTHPIRRACQELTRNAAPLSGIRTVWKKAQKFMTERRTKREAPSGPMPRHPAEDILPYFSRLPLAAQGYVKTLHDRVSEYQVSAPYEGRVVVYISTSQPGRLENRVAAIWKSITPSAEVITVKGTHVSIVEKGDGQALADHLKNKLDQISLTETAATPYPGSRSAKFPECDSM